MILKICPYCRTENPENANFCKKCGALFRGEPLIKDTDAEKNKRKNKLIIAASVVLLVAALAVIMRGIGDTPEVSTTTTTTTASTTDATTLPAVSAPSANATTAPSTTLPTTTATTTTTVSSTAAPVVSTEEICDEFNSIVGKAKTYYSDVKVHKTEKISLEITHFSLPVPTESINTFMARLIPETDITYNFTDRTAKEDQSVLLTDFIPPANALSSVTADDLLSAEKGADGSLTLKFKADSSTFADGQTVLPQYVDSATDVLDFATFSLGPVKIVKADIQYPATEITAVATEYGELTKLIITQPVSVMSTGGVGSLTADVGMNLKAVTTFELTYG